LGLNEWRDINFLGETHRHLERPEAEAVPGIHDTKQLQEPTEKDDLLRDWIKGTQRQKFSPQSMDEHGVTSDPVERGKMDTPLDTDDGHGDTQHSVNERLSSTARAPSPRNDGDGISPGLRQEPERGHAASRVRDKARLSTRFEKARHPPRSSGPRTNYVEDFGPQRTGLESAAGTLFVTSASNQARDVLLFGDSVTKLADNVSSPITGTTLHRRKDDDISDAGPSTEEYKRNKGEAIERYASLFGSIQPDEQKGR
jgi:hypothetical protein